MEREANELERKIDVLVGSFAQQLDGLASADFVREGVLKEALTGLVWAIFHQMPDQRTALADALENWPDLIREAIEEERTKTQA